MDTPESPNQPTVVTADTASRVLGYLIDVLPTVLIGLLALIPIVGAILAGLVLCVYWVSRDIGGSSLGKLVMRTRVALKDGHEAPIAARILRNVPIGLPGCAMSVPVAGYVLGPGCGGLVFLIEAIALLATGERIGDKLANTTVVKVQS
jgi:uncharacterized RDD family membrane protein YckC